MIITALIDIIFSVLSALLSVFPSIPAFPSEVSAMLDTFVGYLEEGMGIVNMFVYGNVLQVMITVSLAVWVLYHGYLVVMWVLRKIPFFGIE